MISSVSGPGVRIFTHEDIDQAVVETTREVQQSMHESTDVGIQASALAINGLIATKSPIAAAVAAPLVNQTFQASATVIKPVEDRLVAQGVQSVADAIKSSLN